MICTDENRAASLAAHALMAIMLASTVALVLAIVTAVGCSPSRRITSDALISHPPTSPPVTVYAASGAVVGSIEYDARATVAQVGSGSEYIARYLRHWGLAHPIAVTAVPRGDLSVGGYRDLEAWDAYVTYQPDGQVLASEWEIPLTAQQVDDPPSWTWGTWGPLYPGQSPFFILLTR